MPKPAHAGRPPRAAEELFLGAGETAEDLDPPATVITVGYEIAGTPQFLEIRASREVDAYALYHWFRTRAGARGPDVRIVETEKTTRRRPPPGSEA
jgi:hypothetical protein